MSPPTAVVPTVYMWERFQDTDALVSELWCCLFDLMLPAGNHYSLLGANEHPRVRKSTPAVVVNNGRVVIEEAYIPNFWNGFARLTLVRAGIPRGIH